MRKAYLSLIAILLSTFGFAQNLPLNGTITGMDGNVLERAWVLVLDEEDNSYVSGAISDENGNFEIEGLSSGNYIITVDHVSFEEPKLLNLNKGLEMSPDHSINLKKVDGELIMEESILKESLME